VDNLLAAFGTSRLLKGSGRVVILKLQEQNY